MKRKILLGLVVILAGCQKKTETILPEKQDQQKPVIKTYSSGDGLYDVLGYGYDVTKEFANSNSSTFKIINVEQLKADYTNRVETDLAQTKVGKVVVSENAEKLSEKLSLKVNATATLKLFKGTITSSYDQSSTFDSKYIFGSYDLNIQKKRLKINATYDLLKSYLTNEFITDVQNNSASYVVSKYGTHIMTDIILGGKLGILYRSETTNSDKISSATAGLEVNIQKIFSASTNLSYNSTLEKNNFSQRLNYKTVGGNSSISLIGQLLLNKDIPVVDITNWENSVSVSNSVLIDFGQDGLIPIYELVDDPIKKTDLQNYVENYLLNNQVSLNQSYPTLPLYRARNNNSSDHLLTTNPGEIAGISYWTLEKQLGNVYANSSKPGTIPLYRYFRGGYHFYTTNINELGFGNGYEGITGYVESNANSQTDNLWRYYGGSTRGYIYTNDWNELGYGNYGYTYEGAVYNILK